MFSNLPISCQITYVCQALAAESHVPVLLAPAGYVDEPVRAILDLCAQQFPLKWSSCMRTVQTNVVKKISQYEGRLAYPEHRSSPRPT